MANKLWKGSRDFDSWTHTSAGPVDDRLYFGGWGNGFSTPSQLSLDAGNTLQSFENGITVSTEVVYPKVWVKSASMQNGEVRLWQGVSSSNGTNKFTAIGWRQQGLVNTSYAVISVANIMYLVKYVGGVWTTLASLGHTQHAKGDRVVMWGKSNGDTHSGGEYSPDFTQMTAVDTALSGAGAWGFQFDGAIYEFAVFGGREIGAAASGVSRSATFDAGAITETADVLHWEGLSLPSGSAVARISAVNAAGAPNFTTTITLSNTNDDVPFPTLTGRYWQIECSLPSGASLTAIGFIKGNDAGGGGGTVATPPQRSYISSNQTRYID